MIDRMLEKWIEKKKISADELHFACGRLSGKAGIFCNLVLFVLKVIAGMISSSAAVMTDGFNNLTDCLNSVISLLGTHFSSRPADAEHPFGHGRMEYIVSFIMTALIFLFGADLLRTGVLRILHPEEVHMETAAVLILFLSIGAKLGLFLFNRKLGKISESLILTASAQDSLNDVLATSITIAALFLSAGFPSFPFDGIGAAAVSLFILKAGLDILKEIIDKLLGTPADGRLAKQIEEVILAEDGVYGVHDLILHEYGPGRLIGSAHAEMKRDLSFVEAHAAIDRAERTIMEKYHILMSIHADPSEADDPAAGRVRRQAEAVLAGICPGLLIHDVRLIDEDREKVISFDVLIPKECSAGPDEILAALQKQFAGEAVLQVTFDRAYTEAS